MRKPIAFFLSLVFSLPLYAQMYPGFKAQEAKDFIALCNSFTYLDLYDSDTVIIPSGYEKIFTSGVFGMDNKYQVYTNGNHGVICFRGSTDDQKSWLANFTSAMIPAAGDIKIKNEPFNYVVSNVEGAAVHSGYMLGLGYLHASVLEQIRSLNRQGIFDIYLTGHSQGGALSALLLAYLDGLPKGTISSRNQFKNYSFANPMVGNKRFAQAYNEKYAETGWSMRVINPADPVPKLPMNYMEEKALSKRGILSLLEDENGFDTGLLLKSAFVQTFEGFATNRVQSMSVSASERLAKDLGDIVFPPYVDDINYFQTGQQITLHPFAYPRMYKEWVAASYDSLAETAVRDSEGYFVDESYYERPPMFYQHKPHNYYVAVLKAYFPEEYDALMVKYLPEDL
ncbi:lipase family protein [Reichenbachiella agariperforans]|uniref:lipase family protein n=1 Tax=Reichenbachiella agariperforans TaxID=156994 RepID=UPI001C09BCB3|nr:hypothetical protein [Reichenbachiella agariperforans]MBU2913277.1 hypothetical protein [Reichenbachiella agariperforans]